MIETDGQIMGSRCADCDLAAFPAARVCRRCLSPNQLPQVLAGHGTLYSYSTVHVASGREVPYRVGYIDLADGVRILGPLDVPDDEIACDISVRLTKGTGGWTFQIDGEQA
ncbi:OB-fold domain-containing protein [Rhodococcus fascians]|nr:OB-fold domain-containing protein [Rhodococcus fascians]MBY4009294.1 OB-fold domain-containing protein [Rhodococcus fascians]MBY4035009.1 OB-fold domain-containing protein [Rhodococcus fascians]MBY4050055.1 OB-fold domain-containing protein [Rhodococcus fascians]MBY4075500.1 OB-fold domain-containing protein [Rhodococcus fascians]